MKNMIDFCPELQLQEYTFQKPGTSATGFTTHTAVTMHRDGRHVPEAGSAAETTPEYKH